MYIAIHVCTQTLHDKTIFYGKFSFLPSQKKSSSNKHKNMTFMNANMKKKKRQLLDFFIIPKHERNNNAEAVKTNKEMT